MLKKIFKKITFVLVCIYATLYLDSKNRFNTGYYQYSPENENK